MQRTVQSDLTLSGCFSDMAYPLSLVFATAVRGQRLLYSWTGCCVIGQTTNSMIGGDGS